MYLPTTAMVDLVLRMDDPLDEGFPVLERGRRGVAEADLVDDEAVDLVAAQVERALVDRVGDIAEGDDVLASRRCRTWRSCAGCPRRGRARCGR